MTKYCPKCKQILPLTCFGKNKAHTNGIRNYCKLCHKAGCLEWANKNQERAAAHRREYYQKNRNRINVRLRQQKAESPEVFKLWMHRGKLKKYGLTEHDYSRMLLHQKGVCAICGYAEENKMLSVDHNHVTGEVRGLLCSKCNLGLGAFKDSSELLASACYYLDKYYFEVEGV